MSNDNQQELGNMTNLLCKRIYLSVLLSALFAITACSSAPAPSDDPGVAESERASDPLVVERDFNDSDLVPLGHSPTKGDPNAPVVIVEFLSLQCPYCARGSATLMELQKQYPEDLQIVFKHLPSQQQPQALDASRVVEAARQQGAFWEMQSGFLTRMSELNTKSAVELGTELAEELNLDVEKLLADLEDPGIDDRIRADLMLAEELGVRGTPNYFINGIQIPGAQSIFAFQEVVQFVLQTTEEAAANGVAEEYRYATLVQDFFDLQAEHAAAQAEAQPESLQNGDVLLAEVQEGDLVYGEEDDFLVTIVEFSSMECPFCARASETMRKIEERYQGKIRFVYKNFPLPNHTNSPRAGRAIYAANQQGQGREMLHLAFDNQSRLGEDAILESMAEELELDMEQFRADLESEQSMQIVQQNRSYGVELGVRGTPAFFINGEYISGAQPESNFAQIIDAEIERAEELREEGWAGDELYRALVQGR